MSKNNKLSEELVILLEGTALSIPFNVVLGMVLSFYMLYKQVPNRIVFGWFITISIISIIRMIYSKLALKNNWYKTKSQTTKNIFIFLIFLTASIWASSYFLFFPFIKNSISEGIVIIFLGGMSVGAMTSLSVKVEAFYAFVLPIFLPLIL